MLMQFGNWHHFDHEHIKNQPPLAAPYSPYTNVVEFALPMFTINYSVNESSWQFFVGINSIHDLAAQNKIKYGTVRDSSVQRYFESQLGDPYTKMAQFMEVERTYVDTGTEGISKVRSSNTVTGIFKSNSIDLLSWVRFIDLMC